MKTYFAISSDMHWVLGSYQRCFSLACEFVEEDLDSCHQPENLGEAFLSQLLLRMGFSK